ncbi:MAG: FAD-dependent oxidoreductase, partial [Propionibacteriaceae bacterium]
MSEVDADVIVIGAGLAGSAAAWALARRGVSAQVLERHQIGHHAGSSHGSSRIFRRAYPVAEYVTLTGRAERLWDELGAEHGQPLLRRTGGVDHGPGRGVDQIKRVFDDLGVAAELLDAEQAQTRWPGMSFDGPVLFTPESGVIDADTAVRALVAGATARGVEVSEQAPVERVEQRGDTVLVHRGEGALRARRVVVAAGAWVPDVLPSSISAR